MFKLFFVGYCSIWCLLIFQHNTYQPYMLKGKKMENNMNHCISINDKNYLWVCETYICLAIELCFFT